MAKEEAKSADVSEMLNATAGLISKEKVDKLVGSKEIVEQKEPVKQEAPVKVPEKINPVVVKTPLGEQVFGGTPVESVQLKSFEDVVAFAKDYAGVEIKDVQDFVTVFNNLKDLRKQAEDLPRLQKTVDTYRSTLDNLPKEVSLILNAAIQGEDHMPIIRKLQQKDVFDFTKPFDAHDPLEVVNHYTKKQYTQETLDALPPEAQEALMDVSKLRYKSDQDDFMNMQSNVKKATEERQNKFQASVESSISQMLVNNPGMGKEAVERVRQIMSYGLSDALFTKDRTYLPDAAEKLAFLEFGKQIVNAQKQTIGDLVAKIRSEAEGKTTERILLRSDKPVLKGGGLQDKNFVQAAVEKETAFLKAK
jgi:hypothetical protein